MKTQEYYAAVADRMLPFVTGRKLTVEQRFRPGTASVYRRHEGTGDHRTSIAIKSSVDIVRWAKQRVEAFHAHIKPEGAGAWFFLDIDSRDLPLEMAQLGAMYALDVIEEANLDAMVKFSGSDGFHLMWQMPSLQPLGRRNLWTFEREVVEAIARQVERRLRDDERAHVIRDAVGQDAPLISTNSQLESPSERAALLFDKLILKSNANARAPYSLHPTSGLVSCPLDRNGLTVFTEAMANPRAVADDNRIWELPTCDVRKVKHALTVWTEHNV